MKISVITATWNSAATVRDTFDSVLHQDYKDVEFIVVDGKSKDGTVDIIREYEPRFEGRMRWVSESDKGIYDAMNKGIAMASGDVIGLLNSDDFFTAHDVLSNVAEVMKDDSLEAIYGDVHYVKSENLSHCVRYYSSRMFSRSMMRFGFMPAHPSFYCRREVYEKYGAYDLSFKIAADFECLLRLIFLHRIRTKYVARDFVTMRQGGASSRGWVSHKQIFRDHRQALKKNGVYSNSFLLSLRYAYKLMELSWQAVFRQ